jgi:multiple sugar transport system permease protein
MRGTATAKLFPYFLLAPALVLVFGLFFYPLFDGIRASLHAYQFGHQAESVGLQNYIDTLKDPHFQDSLITTLKFVAIVVPLETALGLALALLCVQELPFLRFVRATLVIPMVLMPVVVAAMFRLIYASDVGLLAKLTGEPVSILSQPTSAFLGVVALDVWEWTPLMFLILLAGLQSLPRDPAEAARMDGAGTWRVFVDVTLPLLKPVMAVAIVLRTIESFGTFDQAFVLTQGGPGRSTQLISLYGYEVMFKFQQVGFAAAMLVMVGLVVLALTALLVRLLRTEDRAIA